MNAIAKIVSQEVIAGQSWSLELSQLKIKLLAMILLVLLTAFSLLYCKDLSRRMFISYQGSQQVQQQLLSYHNKLLLETTTWSTQGRIQGIAKQQLNMEAPAENDTVIIKFG